MVGFPRPGLADLSARGSPAPADDFAAGLAATVGAGIAMRFGGKLVFLAGIFIGSV